MRYAVFGTMVVLGACLLTAQKSDVPPQDRRFEVASVKRSGPASSPMSETPTRFARSQVTVLQLVQIAFRMPLQRIVGGPAWIRSERYDVEATTAGPTTTAEKDVLLRRFLADRFAFKMHLETRTQAAYALVLSRVDRKLGPNLKKSEFSCAAHQAAGGAPEKVPKRSDGLPVCYPGIRPVADGLTRLTVGGVTMSEFAATLTTLVQRAVVNQTDLPGAYDIDMTFADQQALVQSDRPTDGASLFTSLSEQLGLKLEPTTAPIEFLVIDTVERPTPN